MNVDNMTKLADLLERLPEEKFNMTHWSSEFKYIDGHSEKNKKKYVQSQYIDYYDCNTAGCIAGWAIALKNNLRSEMPNAGNIGNIEVIKYEACQFLGLSESQGENLFLMGLSTVWYDVQFHDFDIFYDSEHEVTSDLITNKMAAKVLRKVISGEVDLDNLDIQYYECDYQHDYSDDNPCDICRESLMESQ